MLTVAQKPARNIIIISSPVGNIRCRKTGPEGWVYEEAPGFVSDEAASKIDTLSDALLSWNMHGRAPKVGTVLS